MAAIIQRSSLHIFIPNRLPSRRLYTADITALFIRHQFFSHARFCRLTSPVAVQRKEAEETIWKEFEFSEIEDLLDDIFPEKKTDFQDLIKKMLSGQTEPSLQVIGEMISDQFFYEWKSSKAGMVHILLIVIVAAVFTNFSNVFQNQQISEISFYVLYLLLITIGLNSFRILIVSASDMESREPANLADVEYQTLEAKVTGKGIRLLGGGITDEMVDLDG